MTQHHYKVFGLNVASELELKTAKAQFDDADVTIRYGVVDFPVQENSPVFQMVASEKGEMCFWVKAVAAFRIEQGMQIIIEQFENAPDESVRLFLLGSAFGFLMHQRNEFPLHGSSVAIGDGCITLVGHSGAGKSSLASGFIDQGYKLLTDDVTRFEWVGEAYKVYHSYPSQKLWKDAVEKLGVDYNPEHRIVDRMDKFYISHGDRFETDPKWLKAVIEINPTDEEAVSLVLLARNEALNTLISHSYRHECMGPYMDMGAHLKSCVAMLKHIPVYRLNRPKEQFTVNEQVKLLLMQFSE